MATKKNNLTVGIVVIVVLLAVALILNVVLATMSNTIALGLGGYSTSTINADAKYDAQYCYEEGFSSCVNLESEGATLLKNDNILPLSVGTEVTLLGAGSYNYIEGGTGSAGGKDDEYTIMMNEAFEEAELSINYDVWDKLEAACGGARNTNAKYDGYKKGNSSDNEWLSYKGIHEFSKATYTDHILDGFDATNKKGIAIVTISRSGAEGASPSMDYDGDGSTLTGTTYLELDQNEKDLLELCNAYFNDTIVLINSATPMELGFINNEEYNIAAALWIGHPGEAGLVGVGYILSGQVNPSGALVDTYAYDMTTNPTYYNNDNNTYANAGEIDDQSATKFYQYEEGIYVGYRYFETADAEGYFDSNEFKSLKFKGHLGKAATGTPAAGTPTVSYEGYDEVVQFSFGYGLSYTTFEQEISNADIPLRAGGENSVRVTVTNTGDTAGKKVVQLYMEAPYKTDTENFGISQDASGNARGLEKAKVVLIGFGKTEEIPAGGSAEVTITFNTDDLASFDNFGQGCYVLENGTYKFNIQENAHCWGEEGSDNAVTASRSVNLANAIIYKPQPDTGVVAGATYVEKRDSDQSTALNAMDDVTSGDGNMYDGYLSRSKIAEGMNSIMAHESNEGASGSIKTSTENLRQEAVDIVNLTGLDSATYSFDTYIDGVKVTLTKKMFGHGNDAGPVSGSELTPDGKTANDESYKVSWEQIYYVEVDSTGEAVYLEDGTLVTYTEEEKAEGEKEGKTFELLSCDNVDLVDPASEVWNQLASMTTLAEAINVQGACGWSTPAVESVGKVANTCKDGPGEPNNSGSPMATWFPCAVIIAATWNVELAYEEGVAYGNQEVLFNIANAYAPAMNTHRSPFGGRNFEYYSEDGFIAGVIGGNAVAGIQSTGTGVFIKHMGLNDNDTNRGGVCTWANEQAIREIYSRPYEISCKEYEANGIMGSLNRIGLSWAHYGHYTTMLRDEWGWNGHLITDGDGSDGEAYNNPNFWLYGTRGSILSTHLLSVASTEEVYGKAYSETNYGQYLLQQTIKHCLFQYSKSGKVEGNFAWWWVSIWIVLNVLIFVGIVLVVIFKIIPAVRKKQ